MNDNGPVSAPKITAHAAFDNGMSDASISATWFPKKYTILSIQITNNTEGPIQLVEAGWPLTGTSLEAFEIEEEGQRELRIPYFRDFSSDGLKFKEREFAPIIQRFSYSTEDGLICTLELKLTVDIRFGVLHPSLHPDWSLKVGISGNKQSIYTVKANISKKIDQAPFSFNVNLTIG